ncbi:hypothetical protein JHD50_04075 [Sulfurimonas sp. MAG313]|nr:hypothetical protein [Sulfurimonas sp. MAG313]MDF1880488.1 hypothetical protein [Sulfurimonas sp. MAG313]
MEITGNGLVELMFLSMTDNRIVETINNLGLEQPTIDEQYELDLKVRVADKDNNGITFIFKEIDGYTSDGEPCLTQIDFYNKCKIKLPYALSFDDDYKTCCKKFGKEADYIDKWMKKGRIWLKTTEEGLDFLVVVHFIDKEFSQLQRIIVVKLNKEDIGDTLFENKE